METCENDVKSIYRLDRFYINQKFFFKCFVKIILLKNREVLSI